MTSPIRRIMIVDDHDAVRRGVRNLVETKPYYQVVGEAANGRDALELARDTSPDITILDYSLPELNGLDLAHSLKKNHPRMEILLYTMHDREEVIMEVLQQIAEGRINKEIAQELGISVKTVETHRASAMHKLKLRTTADLVRYAIRNNII